MRFLEFKIVEGYKEVTQKFAQEVDPEQVSKAIAMYKDLVNRNQVQGNERNIDWWGKQGWEAFRTFVNSKSQQKSQTQQKKRKATGNSHTLGEDDTWLIVVPLDKDASCFHGKGSDWCTTKPEHDYFEQYFRDAKVTLIYFLQKQTGKKWAIAVYNDYGDDEYFDINDSKISNGMFADQTGIPIETVMKYVHMVSDKTTDVSKKADAARSTMKNELGRLKELIEDLISSKSQGRSPEVETLLLKTKDAQSLRKYLYILNKEDTRFELDQNMQTLVALKAADMVEHVSNITPKTGKILMQHNPKSIVGISASNLPIAHEIVKNNPNLIPHPRESSDYFNLAEKIQKLFMEHNPLWFFGFESNDDLSPELEAQKEKILTAYFKRNPDTYALVTEVGLTDLEWMQELTEEEYIKAVRYNGASSFEVFTRDLQTKLA